MEKISTSTGPSAKFGTESPKSVNTPTARSAALPRRCAASTPAGIPIAARESGKIFSVLHEERLVEPERVAQLLQIFGARAFAEHLLHGVAGHDVDQQENERED